MAGLCQWLEDDLEKRKFGFDLIGGVNQAPERIPAKHGILGLGSLLTNQRRFESGPKPNLFKASRG